MAGPAPERHIPVLLKPVLDLLAPADGEVYLDGTFGAGGYTRAILGAANCRVIALDRDRTAIAAGFDLVDSAGGRLTLVEDRFSNLADAVAGQGFETIDGIVMDVGVSSMQLDQAERGFSFRLDGPLDMRMAQTGPSAADVVAAASQADLTRVLAILGEEKFARPVARAIVAARKDAPITTTRALAGIISNVVHQRFGEIHPATRTFQALRILVNEELDELQQALVAAERVLKPGGRLVVVSFHSLEDRIVKTFMTQRSQVGGGSRHQPEIQRAPPSFTVLTKRAVAADAQEVSLNPRARSAKLRAAMRTTAPMHDDVATGSWPSLAEIMRGE
jgi:16S rRNA (cytosine1402-N4)-methyltransferase